MYAIITNGGKQYRVEEGQHLKLEKMPFEPGDKVSFDQVLLLANEDDIQVGTPSVDAQVAGEVVDHGRGKKINIIKFKRRKHHMKRRGHRQDFTEVKITSIQFPGKESFSANESKEAEEK